MQNLINIKTTRQFNEQATSTPTITATTMATTTRMTTTTTTTSTETTTTTLTATATARNKRATATSRASTTGTTAHIDADDPTWTSASFTANGALIYNDTNSDKAIAVLAFGGDFTVAGGTFKIVFPAAGSTAIIRID